MEAIFYAQQASIIRNLSPAPFLDAALLTGNKTLFLNVYRFFEEYGLIPLAGQDDLFVSNRTGNLNRYRSVFREILGPSLEMDSI